MCILVVDDPNVLSFIEQGLKEEGYVVDVATNDELALDFAQTYPYDVIVLDVLLPKVDGRVGGSNVTSAGPEHAHYYANRP